MKIRILTITHKTPTWITAGFNEYAKRLPPQYALELVEIPAEKRHAKSDIKNIIERESEKLLTACKPTHRIVTLDVKGKYFSTEQLATLMNEWQQSGRGIDLLIGGPDGLSETCLKKAEMSWSLSPLTFPHFLVKLILAEQIYRVFTINTQHPYHR